MLKWLTALSFLLFAVIVLKARGTEAALNSPCGGNDCCLYGTSGGGYLRCGSGNYDCRALQVHEKTDRRPIIVHLHKT